MANKFSEIAKKETSLSPVMENRNKVSIDDIRKTYPDGVTITEFDFIRTSDPKKGDSTYPVFAIKENPHVCFFGGTILNKICLAWTAEAEGDVNEASRQLKEAGGVKVRMIESKTKSGNSVTLVEIVD